MSRFLLTFIERWLHYRGRLQCFSAVWGQGGCFREVAALYSDLSGDTVSSDVFPLTLTDECVTCTWSVLVSAGCEGRWMRRGQHWRS